MEVMIFISVFSMTALPRSLQEMIVNMVSSLPGVCCWGGWSLTSEMLDTGSVCTSVELMISGEVVSRISTATPISRRALKDTPSPRPSLRSWCSSIRV